MLAAPIPGNDAERLAALHAMLILDSPPEARYDKVVQFARDEFNVPIALMSLVDTNRQWFKSKVGLDVCETDRSISFCGHAILQDDIFVIPDTLSDPRFVDNPLVTGEPHIRFYAGAPLVLPSGLALGTLCLIDQKPREIDLTELAILRTLRDLLMYDLLTPPEPNHA